MCGTAAYIFESTLCGLARSTRTGPFSTTVPSEAPPPPPPFHPTLVCFLATSTSVTLVWPTSPVTPLLQGVLRFTNAKCLEATLCNTCNIGGSSSAMASDIAEMKAQIAANAAISNDIIYRLEAIENQSIAHENILNPPCPNRDLGSATNPATSCKAIMDLRTADATVWPSECSLPDSGIFYVSHRVAQSPLLHRLHAPPPPFYYQDIHMAHLHLPAQ